MIFRDIKTNSAETRISYVLLILLALVPFTAGCSFFSSIDKSAKRIVRDVRSPGGNLKKKVGVAFFENKTSLLNQGEEQHYLNYLVENIKKSCSEIILVKPGDPEYPDFLVKIPKHESGWVDTLALAEAGRQAGFNAIVTGALTDITKTQKERGFWWFKNIHHFMEVHVTVDVYDTFTGAKLLDESFVQEMEVDETDFEDTNISNDFMPSIINEALHNIADQMGEQVCYELILQPWKGFITSVAEDKVTLSSGKRVGINSGDILEVYDSSEIFSGSQGQRFFVPGLKTGEIKITSVFIDIAEAIPISGSNIQTGSSVSLKD